MSVAELDNDQITTIWSHLSHNHKTTASSPEQFATDLRTNRVNVTDLIMACLDRSGAEWDAILSALMGKPLYKCAPGETAFPLTDAAGRIIPSPKGHRFGLAPTAPPAPPPPPRTPRPRTTKRDPRVILSVCENPKVPGSKAHSRFALYAVGMTVDEFIAAGGRKTDIAYDTQRGFIKLGYEQ